MSTRHTTLFAGVLVFCAGFLLVNNDEVTPVRRPERSGAMEALEFWSMARTYPHGTLSPDAQFRAFEALQRRVEKGKTSLFASSAWNYIGPANLSGRMLCVAVNPLNPSTIYAGSASGGLWRSYTGGLGGDWQRIATGYPVLGVGAIAVDPADSNTIYIGTGEVYRYNRTAGGIMIRTTRGSYGMGILKTTDGGSTWVKSLDWSYNQERGVQMIRINPLNSSSVWAATSEGIYRSTNAGVTWSVRLPVPMGEDIIIHPVDTLHMLASTGNLGLTPYIYKTVDGGGYWFPVTPIPFTGKTLLAQYAGDPDIVFASIADSTTGVGSLWRTTNFGTSWSMLSNNTTNNIFGVQGWYSHFVAVHPSDPSIVFHAGVPASRSSDGGVTFSGVGGTYSDHHGYAYDPTAPDTLYVANDDGIYRSTNFGQNFTKVSTNLGTGQFYAGFSNSATDSLLALGQVQDHIPGYLYQGSVYWPGSAADEVGWTGIDQIDDHIMYAGTRAGGAVRKTTDRGSSWFNSSGGFSGLACWNTPFVVSPSDPNVLYFGRSRIFKSTNSAGSWFATNGGNQLPDGNPPISMAISATNPDSVFVGTAPYLTRTHLYRTTNGGGIWTDVTGSLPDRYPLDIAFDAATPAIVYVGYGGYGTGHVYKTTDAGDSWWDKTGDLPDLPVTAILVDPLNSDIVYLGNDIGVYISTNGGNSWMPFGEGLPEAALVSDLTMTSSNRTLRASTHGNSVFERKMPSVFPDITLLSPNGGETWEVGQVETISWSEALVQDVTIQYSTDDGSSWTDVAVSIPAYPDTFAWMVPPPLTTVGRVRVVSTSDSNVLGESASPFTIAYPGIIYDLAADWNLLSIPLIISDYSTASLFPSAIRKTYVFDGSYLEVDTLGNGGGYWLKFGAQEYLPLQGDSIDTDTITVSGGWNLIGSLSEKFSASALLSEPDGLIQTPPYGYEGGYFTADSIEPGRGYWVKVSGAGSLILQSGSSLTMAQTIRVSPVEMSHLDITDAAGHGATLYLTCGENRSPAAYELPPVPPRGAFDVRFQGDRSALRVDTGAGGRIQHQGLSLPLTITWEVRRGESYVLSAAGSPALRLAGSGSQVLKNVEDLAVRADVRSGGTVPASSALRQNFPNPFNPVTRIRFFIPEGANRERQDVPASLVIYDLAGRQVASLVNDRLAPGEHDARWDATGFPSGVYVATLRTSGGRHSMKMLLLK